MVYVKIKEILIKSNVQMCREIFRQIVKSEEEIQYFLKTNGCFI